MVPENKVISTTGLKPKRFSFTMRDFRGVEKRKTRPYSGSMFTTLDLEEHKRLAKRAEAVAQKKALITSPKGIVGESEPATKKRGRPKTK
jgi:hypothetical protein